MKERPNQLFISGSISIKKLPLDVETYLLRRLNKEAPIVLIGDAGGVDTLVQQFLFRVGYLKVVVYFSGEKPRNKIGNFALCRVRTFHPKSNRLYHVTKDIALAKDSDEGFVVWDGKSIGSLNNIRRMQTMGKPSFFWDDRFQKIECPPGDSNLVAYEVSTKGDKRFSALNAMLEDGRSIEMHYQCDVKGYDPGGVNWRIGKGKPPLNKELDCYKEYKKLWERWCNLNPELVIELVDKVLRENLVLVDSFATSPVSQAKALSDIIFAKLKPRRIREI